MLLAKVLCTPPIWPSKIHQQDITGALVACLGHLYIGGEPIIRSLPHGLIASMVNGRVLHCCCRLILLLIKSQQSESRVAVDTEQVGREPCIATTLK